MTEQVLHEKEIFRLSRVLKGIRDIHKQMIGAESEEALLAGVCKIIVEDIGYEFSWVGLTEEGTSVLRQVSWTGDRYTIKGLNAEGSEAEFKKGILGSAIKTGKTQVFERSQEYVPDISRTCNFACSLPLTNGNHTIGSLDIHSGEENVFQREELKLLEEVASDLSFAINTLRDRQKQQEAEKKLRESEERIRLTNQLQQSQKMEAIARLAGGIAHDFNNLLAIILGNIQLAEMDSDPDDRIYENLSGALQGCIRAKHLTKQFLTLSKGESPVMKTGAFGNFIQETADLALAGSNVSCEFFIADNLLPVRFDEGQMRQVFNNVIANACDSLPEGGTVQIYAENISVSAGKPVPGVMIQDGKYVRIVIRDQGIGIPQKYLSVIFDPYFSTKETGIQKGTGLGLTVAYSILEKHGGYIRVTSEEGIGTDVCIYLPAFEPEIIRKKREEMLPFKGKILVMDDEKMICELLKKVLKRLGYKAETVRSGFQAIELYKKAMNSGDPFDAVILDLTVRGGMGGEETIRKLMETDRNVRAIISSGYSNDPVMRHYARYGFRGAIPKPCQIRELDNALCSVLITDNQ